MDFGASKKLWGGWWWVHLDYNVSSLALFCQKSNVRKCLVIFNGEIRARPLSQFDGNMKIFACLESEFLELSAILAFPI